MGKNYMRFFYGKKYNSGNGTFSLETGENFIEGTGLEYSCNSMDNKVQGLFRYLTIKLKMTPQTIFSEK